MLQCFVLAHIMTVPCRTTECSVWLYILVKMYRFSKLFQANCVSSSPAPDNITGLLDVRNSIRSEKLCTRFGHKSISWYQLKISKFPVTICISLSQETLKYSIIMRSVLCSIETFWLDVFGFYVVIKKIVSHSSIKLSNIDPSQGLEIFLQP